MKDKKLSDVERSDDDAAQNQVPWWTSCRLALSFVSFLGFINLYALRVNMSIAIVCMVNQTAIKATSNELWTNQSEAVVEDTCPAQTANRTALRDGEFVWKKELQGIILGSFFWGYILTQIPGGWLAGRFGGKRVLGVCMLVTAIATLLTPIGSRGSPYLLMILRFINGLGQGVVFPAMHVIWSQWAPPLERSKLIGFSYAGAQIGNVITMPLSGMLCDKGFAGGWPSIFYVLGLSTVAWFILWMIVVAENPDEHPRITEIEKCYIQTEIGATKRSPEKEIPWMTIFKSPAVWAIIIGHMCANFGTYMLLTNIPAYMREVLKFDIKTNGLMSAIPYIVYWTVISIGGILADYLQTKGMRTEVVRKIMYALGTLLPAGGLIGTGYITCQNPYIAVAILAVAVGCSGFQYPGFTVNHVDIAPPFAGILYGMSNTAGTFSGVVAPYAIGRITVDQTQRQWQIVFYVAAVVYLTGAVVFSLLAKGEVQDWVKPYMFEDHNDKNGGCVTEIAESETADDDTPNMINNHSDPAAQRETSRV